MLKCLSCGAVDSLREQVSVESHKLYAVNADGSRGALLSESPAVESKGSAVVCLICGARGFINRLDNGKPYFSITVGGYCPEKY
jgi:hypothetical protein